MPPNKPPTKPSADLQHKFTDLLKESLQDKEINEVEKKELQAVTNQIQQLLATSPEARQAFVAAVKTVAAKHDLIPLDIYQMIFGRDGDEGKRVFWLTANLEPNPEKLKTVLEECKNIEKHWNTLRSLPLEKRKKHPAHKTLGQSTFLLEYTINDLSDTQYRECLKANLVQRLSNLYFDMYSKGESKNAKFLVNTIADLTMRGPRLVEPQIVASRFLEQSQAQIEANLSQRKTFFVLARKGHSPEKSIGYMESSTYKKLAQDVQAGKITLPKGLAYTVNQATAFEDNIMRFYNRSSSGLARVYMYLSSQQTPRSASIMAKRKLLSTLFRLATHPSPRNGHVTCSTRMTEALAGIAEKNPKLFTQQWLDQQDPLLGQSPREFFLANGKDSKDMPFMKLTDSKSRFKYSRAIKRLVKALQL